ncbi:MAG: hypothetical protein ONA90_08375 [candidate division KSB1 bacterium]|nr:hypothetical protein [candidate division KSB1 bacterium]
MSSLAYSLRGRLRRIEQEKLWTCLLTALLVLMLYSIVNQITIPQQSFDVTIFEEIDFTRFQASPKMPEPPKKRLEERASHAAPPIATPNDIPELDLAAFQEMLTLSKAPAKEVMPLEHKPSDFQPIQAAEVNVGALNIPSLKTPVMQARPGGLPIAVAPSDNFNPSLKTTANLNKMAPVPAYATGRQEPLKGMPPLPRDGDKIEIKKFDTVLEKIDFESLFKELLAWLRENQSELSPALRHYMRYKPGDVTAKVTIPTLDAVYDLFFLCNEHSQDIGLLLVTEGDSASAIMLRDVGFRKRSYSLFIGIAGRNEEREVASVSMFERKPTVEQTSRFYNIFLSWWEKHRPPRDKKSRS